jgi:ParB family chromosome partitioning protein
VSRPRRPALGRGLGALLPGKPTGTTDAARSSTARADATEASGSPAERRLPIERLVPNPDQPRRHFDAALLDELAQSIRTQGVIQPILVTPAAQAPGQPRSYVIVAGERRWRAAQRAGLQEVPVVVREVDEQARLELALVENIQRADLNPIEEAKAYQQLSRLRGYTQEDLAGRVGKDRSTVANALRLLKLPPRVQALVVEGKLSMGHARALLGLPDEDAMTALAAQIVREGLSVRATEVAVRKRAAPEREPAAEDDETTRHQIIVGELESRLRRRLGVKVRLNTAGKKDRGVMEIPYGSLDELDRLLRVILGDPATP